jgi:hypothetical protein
MLFEGQGGDCGLSSKNAFYVFLLQERGNVPAKGPQVLVHDPRGEELSPLETPGPDQQDDFMKLLLIVGFSSPIGPMIRRYQGVYPVYGTPFAGSIRHGLPGSTERSDFDWW